MDLSQVTHDALLNYFRKGWEVTEQLFSGLADDGMLYEAPDKLRHPLIFYLAHPAVFYVNKMVAAGLVSEDERIRPEFEGSLFAIGVDEMSWDDLDRPLCVWPEASAVREYRSAVKALVERKIAEADLPGPISWDHPLWSVVMGAEHERIHIETSSVLMRQAPLSRLRTPEGWPKEAPAGEHAAEEEFANPMVRVADSEVVMGKPTNFPSYGWDNEYGTRAVTVPAFEASTFKVTNSEFFSFVKAGAYLDQSLWTDEGWAWRTFTCAEHPLFWVKDDAAPGGFRYRTVFTERAMPWKWPAHVNYHEAAAFCAWRSRRDGRAYRPLSEAEWYAALGGFGPGASHGVHEDPVMAGGAALAQLNVDLQYATSRDVDAEAETASGVRGLMGSAWEWTADDADALVGFKVHPYYRDFSTPCLDGRHNIIKGGSFISLGDEASVYARFWFRRHFFQHAGFRLCTPLAPVSEDLFALGDVPHKLAVNKWSGETNAYERTRMVDDYLLYAFGEGPMVFPYEFAALRDVVGNFTVKCAEETIAAVGDRKGPLRALEIGSAVGRAAFELARHFDTVVGVEYGRLFVHVAKELARTGTRSYTYVEEGGLVKAAVATVDPAIDRSRVSFEVGDACNLRADIGQYDAVLAANLIDRTQEPMRFLERLPSLVLPGGVAVITSPYTWLDEWTPRANWLGGFTRNGAEVRTLDVLKEVLGEHFELVNAKDLPLIIREHSRKFQLCVAHCTVWKRKE